jgi:hypothetical protein
MNTLANGSKSAKESKVRGKAVVMRAQADRQI